MTEKDTEALKKAIAQGNAKVDPLSAKDFYKDDALARIAAENGAAFEVNLAPIIKSPAGQRAQSLREARIFLEKCVKYNAKFAIVSESDDPMDIKSPRELQAIATTILGLDWHRAKAAVNPAP